MNYPHANHVLGVHPSSRGFGWAIFEGPASLFDWGTADIRGNKNAKALMRLERILDKYQPGVLSLEAFEGTETKRAPRIRTIYRGLIKRAEARGIAVHLYTRARIRSTFADTGARTREEVAATVAERMEVLRPRLPKPRKIWIGEHPNIALFCAAALALTYFAVEYPGDTGAY